MFLFIDFNSLFQLNLNLGVNQYLFINLDKKRYFSVFGQQSHSPDAEQSDVEWLPDFKSEAAVLVHLQGLSSGEHFLNQIKYYLKSYLDIYPNLSDQSGFSSKHSHICMTIVFIFRYIFRILFQHTLKKSGSNQAPNS